MSATTNVLPANSKTAFLDIAPPYFAARGLAWAIIIVFVLGAIALVAIQMPEKVTAQFVLVPVRGADPVKAVRGGTVERVMASEGQTIKQGDLIVTLRSEAAAERAADLQTVETHLAGAGESFINSRLKLASQQQGDDQEARKLESRAAHLDTLIAHKRQQLALTQKMFESYEKLYREGIASQAQLTSKQIEVSELSSEVERLIIEQRDARADAEKIKLGSATRETEFREFAREFKEKARTNEIHAAALKTGLANTDGGEVRIVAPCSGTILKLRVRDAGAMLSAGETVAELACGGEQLVAELNVPESGIGKLKVNQGVKLKYDAFPYQRYGAKYGKLAWLSPAKAAQVEGQPASAFTARVELGEREITVKGQPKALAAGMVGTAEIIVGKRTLISYVFEPVKQLRENMADTP